MHKLADGSLSVEYKLGDKFKVSHRVSEQAVFSEGSIVSFYEDDESEHPLFKLESGNSEFFNCDGEAGGYCYWFCLTPAQQY